MTHIFVDAFFVFLLIYSDQTKYSGKKSRLLGWLNSFVAAFKCEVYSCVSTAWKTLESQGWWRLPGRKNYTI